MKRIVICADGTWNKPSATTNGVACPTNVVRIAQAVAPSDPIGVTQVVFYHDGVGTHPGVDRILGGMFGIGLDRIICDIYRFLVHNFEPGDELFFFGFSRGAFTVRSVAGMIRKCGILRKHKVDQVADAFDFYRNDVKPAEQRAVDWRAERSNETRITCIAVWDTVGALGIPFTLFRLFAQRKYQFHDVSLSTTVDNAFHALAIDERRKPFLPTIWQIQSPDPLHPQTVRQIWFAGVHSDIGGGYASSDLSDIALAWMIRQAQTCRLAFDPETTAGVIGNPCGEIHDSMTSYYKILGNGIRGIEDPTPVPTPPAAFPVSFEELDASVLTRFDAMQTMPQPYEPRPLVDYFARVRR